MDKIIYNLVFNRKKKLNTKGTGLIQVEAYLNKMKKYFSTKVYIRPEEWDEKKQIVINHPNAEALNRMLYDYVIQMEKKELLIWQGGKPVTLEALKESIQSTTVSGSFIAFFNDEINKSSLKNSTKKNHLSTIKLLNEYKKKITFADLTYDFICSFDYFLQSRGYHTNTIAKHMKHLKKHINNAINKGHIDLHDYAFRKYKIKNIKNNHTYLAPEDLSTLENLKLEQTNKKYQKTLDAFLFCCYTGLRYSDFVNLTSQNIILMNNQIWMIYTSVKTKIEVRLPLYLLFEGKSLQILEKYKNNLEEFFLIKDNSNINKELDKISQIAGLNKHISFHTARHTNATLLIYNGINITSVQKILGHKSVRTTQIYSNVMDMTLVKDLEKIYKGNI